jgi:exo-1,4-beta-D-glucosaminidase
MTRAPSGDHELPSSTWPDRDIARLPGGSQPLKDTCGLSRLQGASPLMSVPGWNMPMLDCLPTHP